MKSIAIITSAVLPVPAIKGGAVETLITQLIESNESNPKCHFDVYTMPDVELNSIRYQYTNVRQVQGGFSEALGCKILNKVEQLIHVQTTSLYDYTLLCSLKKGHYDYVLVENTAHFYHLAYKIKKYRNRLVFHLHNNVDSARTECDLRFISDTAYRILTVSNYTGRLVQSIRSSENIRTLYNCVDRRKFAPGNSAGRDRIRSKYRLEQKTVIMFSGRLETIKGFPELFEAFAHMVRSGHGTDAALMIVGGNSPWADDAARSELNINLVSYQKQLGDKVVFTGMISYSEMPDYYAAADIMTVPSMWEEPFGMIALEAMTCGLPLVISDSGGLPEIVNDGCAIVVKRGNCFIKELSAVLSELVEDAKLRQKMRKASLQRMEEMPEFDAKNYIWYFEDKMGDKR